METLLEPENILNVTLLEPKLKHPTIFVRFDELISGEPSFFIMIMIPNRCIMNYLQREEIFLTGNTLRKGLNFGE